jgi:hypothetical protein
MLLYLFFWYVILVLWARRALPFRLRKWIGSRFIRAQIFAILAFLIAQLNPTHWTLRIYHLLLKNWMHVKFC